MRQLKKNHTSTHLNQCLFQLRQSDGAGLCLFRKCDRHFRAIVSGCLRSHISHCLAVLDVQNGNVEAARMPADKLDVPDKTYNAAICALGLMYMPDPAAAVSEMARGVAAGGTVAATAWGERRKCGWSEVFPIVDSRVASEVCPMFFGTGAPNALKRLFEDAGLKTFANTVSAKR